MVEGLLVVLELATEISHPVNVELSCSHVERPRVEPLAEALSFGQAVKDAVHGHLSFILLVSCSDTGHEILTKRSITVAVPCSLLKRSLILEGTAARAIAQVTVVVVRQEVCYGALALEAFEGNLGALSLAFWLLHLGLLTVFLLIRQ